MHVNTHAWLKSQVLVACACHISLSSHLLPSHVSPVLAPAVPRRSLRDHSRLRPRRPHTDVSVHTILPNFPDLKGLVKRTPHEDEQSGYLTKSVANTRTASRKRSRDSLKERVGGWARKPSRSAMCVPPNAGKSTG